MVLIFLFLLLDSTQTNFFLLLLSGRASDIRVTGVGDAENTDAEVTTAGSAEVDVGPAVVVDAGLRQMSVVLNLRAHQRGAVVGDDHKLSCKNKYIYNR